MQPLLIILLLLSVLTNVLLILLLLRSGQQNTAEDQTDEIARIVRDEVEAETEVLADQLRVMQGEVTRTTSASARDMGTLLAESQRQSQEAATARLDAIDRAGAARQRAANDALLAQLQVLETRLKNLEDTNANRSQPAEQDVYQQILARLDGRGIRFVVDATRDLLVKVLPYHPFLIKPNNHELGEIFGKELNRDEEITQAARKLQQRGARNVLVSMAGDGALLLDETGAVHRIGTPKGKVVNSVGAGDSMVAGFIAGYLQSGSYSYALRLGTACGSATAFSLGLAERRDIDALLKTIE